MLSMSDKFQEDIESSNIEIYPIIVINNNLYISTVKESIDGNKCLDLNLSISTVKEAINLKEHTYRISNVNFTLSNYPYSGANNSERFSDIANNYFNTSIEIYYKTPSCVSLSDCLNVYNGIIRKVKHDDKTVSIEAEDRTEYLINKDVPTANLGYKENVFNKNYINKPIPFTYGEVSRAPVVPYIYKDSESSFSSIAIIADDVGIITSNERNIQIKGFGTDEPFPENTYFQHLTNYTAEEYPLKSFNPLYIYKGDYFRVLQEYNAEVNADSSNLINFPEPQQYIIEEHEQSISIFKEFIAGFPQNPPAANEFQTVIVRYPNQCSLLKSANTLDGDSGANGETGIINLDVPEGILNPQAAIDNSFFTSTDYGSVAEFDTHCEIPNTFQTIEESEFLTIHEFTPFAPNTYGWFHPDNEAGDVTRTSTNSSNLNSIDPLQGNNYLMLIYGWSHTYMHKVPASYVQLPCVDYIQEHVDLWLRGEYGSNMGDDKVVYTTEDSIFDWGHRKAEFRPQHCISPAIGYRYASTVGNEVQTAMGTEVWSGQDYDYDFNYNNKSDSTAELAKTYYSTEWNTGSNHRNYRYQAYVAWRRDSSTNFNLETCNAHKTLSGRNVDHDIYAPTNVYKFSLRHFENGESLDDINPLLKRNVYVGLWVEETMNDVMLNDSWNWANDIWINLWNLNDGRPYLYESREQFCVIKPTALTYKYRTGNNLACKYRSNWNGVGINEWIDNNGNKSTYDASYNYNSLLSSGNLTYYFAAGLDLDGTDQKHVVGNNLDGSNTFGGGSWFVVYDEEEPNVCKNLADSTGEVGEDLGEWYDDAATVRMAKNTLIPCNIKNGSGQFWGNSFNMDYILDPNSKTVNISVGQDGTFEERLSVLLPMGDLSADDSFNVDTFVYGKVNIEFPALDENYVVHNLDSTSKFSLSCVATEVVDVSALDFNAISPDIFHGTELISIDGDSSKFSSDVIETATWDVSTLGETEGNDFVGISNRIESWDEADKFNAISLVYRLTGSNPDHYVKIATKIFSMGVVQFVNFDKALDSNFYADVKGRISGSTLGDYDKYVLTQSEGKALITNPCDVLYHFLTEECGQDIVDRSSWVSDRNNTLGINMAFSVTTTTKSKDIINGIAKNTNIIPTFDSLGNLSFRAIKQTYAVSMVDSTIKSKDIVKYKFSRTPVSEIKTLVNVKYKKDYETEEYTRETGWTDALDFYGNENYISSNNSLKEGYSYSSLGINRETNVYTHESDYIRDSNSAAVLRDFILAYFCNQHMIIDLELPLKYMKLQAGDLIKFDELINNLKSHGEDYTSTNVIRNGQKIYPFFIIESISRNVKTIKIKVVQMHDLTPTFSCGAGSLSRKSERGVSHINGQDYLSSNVGVVTDENPYGNLNVEDLELYENYILGESRYFTNKMLQIGDIDGNGSIDINDLNIINILLGFAAERKAGDLNSDGVLNVSDIVTLVGYLLNGDIEDSEIVYADLNEDGVVNVTDIVVLVNNILGNE